MFGRAIIGKYCGTTKTTDRCLLLQTVVVSRISVHNIPGTACLTGSSECRENRSNTSREIQVCISWAGPNHCVYARVGWAPPNYVGIADFQDGGSNNVYSVYTAIWNKCSRLRVHRASYIACPSLQ